MLRWAKNQKSLSKTKSLDITQCNLPFVLELVVVGKENIPSCQTEVMLNWPSMMLGCLRRNLGFCQVLALVMLEIKKHLPYHKQAIYFPNSFIIQTVNYLHSLNNITQITFYLHTGDDQEMTISWKFSKKFTQLFKLSKGCTKRSGHAKWVAADPEHYISLNVKKLTKNHWSNYAKYCK